VVGLHEQTVAVATVLAVEVVLKNIGSALDKSSSMNDAWPISQRLDSNEL
jgi:hypothetical protein